MYACCSRNRELDLSPSEVLQQIRLTLFSTPIECLINALVLSHTAWLYLNLSKHNNRPSLFSSHYIWPVYHSNPSTEQSEVWTTIPVSQIHSIWKAIALVWFSSASTCTVDHPVTPGVLLWVFGWMLLASIAKWCLRILSSTNTFAFLGWQPNHI